MARTELVTIFSLSLVFVMVALLQFTVVGGFGTLVGGKTEINDVKTNKEVQELGKFSVEEFNKGYKQPRYRRKGGEGTEELLFSEVVEAKKQLVSGINYFLKVEATQNGVTRTFDSVVFVKPWLQAKHLVTFGPSAQEDQR